jgi:hypothetical protein
MAAMLWLMDSLVKGCKQQAWEWPQLIVSTLILALMQPYALVTLGAVAGLWMVTRWVRERRLPWRSSVRLIGVVALAMPYVAYTWWALANDQALSGWDRQNITLSPPLWDYLLSIGLLLPFTLMGAAVALRRRNTNDLMLLFWVGVSFILLYLPNYSQQRRFAFALFVPLAILAVQGLTHWRQLDTRLFRFAFVAFSSITNIILLAMIAVALSQHPSYLFFTQSEWNGLLYLRSQADQHALVLASPDMGLYIPAWAGQRVIYGHPHETANAKARATEAQQFYEGRPSVALTNVDFIFIGPRESLIGSPLIPASFAPVFTDGDVVIYSRKETSTRVSE